VPLEAKPSVEATFSVLPRICESPSTLVDAWATAASFVMSATLIETPTPMPSSEPVPTVSPFAEASAIVAARVFALTTPPALIVMSPT
jgi:hypothetical protein